MFVPRSARRVRFVRAAFVSAVLLPSALLVTWAVLRRSAAHRDAIRMEWERAIGLPIAVETVEHPLPGVVRARGCSLAAPDGRPVLATAGVRVEFSPTEVRIGIEAIDCDPAGAGLLAALAQDWLRRGARFRRAVVVDVADLAWVSRGTDGVAVRRPVGAVRVECVMQGGDRAVRIVRRDAGDAADEARVVRAEPDGTGGERLDVEASWHEPLPASILAAVCGGAVDVAPLGGSTVVRGRLAAACAGGRWTGSATGRVEGIDLAACTAALAGRAVGTMDVVVRGVEWRGGRLATADLTCDAPSGRVDRRLLESLVSTLGCRAGPAFVGAAVERDRVFDAVGCAIRIDGRGLELAGSPRLGGALAVAAGRPLLESPVGIVPLERLAWMLAPSGAVYVPSSGPGSWLMSILPRGDAAVERTSQVGAESGSGGF